jgi:WD40 repeat protein
VQRHARLSQLYLECSELGAGEQADFLARSCGEDRELRVEVEAMLDFDSRRPGFLERGLGRSAGIPGLRPQALPRSIGKFRVVGCLGEGGMGTVFEAEQDHPRRTVALKLLRTGFSGPRLLRRFEQEGELLGRLEHPGIARIYEAGQVETELGPQPWLSMELVRGVPLTHWARAHPGPPRERLVLFAGVCDAVQHAHEHGVVHRDLKPANILVDGAGQPHVLDFGIARALDAVVRLTTQHLGAGEILGTLAYMSPEQASGETDAIDERSDVYSLGVILHELLAGELPYPIPERSLPDAVAAILEVEPRRLGRVQRAFRGDLEIIALTALEKDRRRRYASAAALAADVRHYLCNEPIEARPPSHAYVLRKFVRRNRLPVAAVSAVFLALAAGLVTSLRFGLGEAEQRARANPGEAEASAAAFQAGILAAQTLLDAGSFDAARTQLAATPVEMRGWAWGALDHRLNAMLAELAVPRVWNAAFRDDERVIVVDESGGACEWDAVTDERTWHDPGVPGARPIALARDGRMLLSALGEALFLCDPLGSGGATRIPFPAGEPAGGWRRAAIAPDGRRLAVATKDNALWLVEPGSSAPVERLAEPAKLVHNLAFSPDAHLLAVGTTQHMRLYDCERRGLVWDRRNSETVFQGLVFDPSRGLLIAGAAGGIRFFDLETGEVRETWSPYEIKTQSFGAPFDLALVPGGRLLAVLFSGGDLWLMDLDTREVRASAAHRGWKQVSLAVASGGEALLTCGRTDDAIRLWNAKPQPAEILQSESDSIYPLAISADGALVASGSWDGRAWIWDLRSGRRIAALDHRGHVDSVAFAPDGRTLACGSALGGLYLWDIRSGAALAHRPEIPAYAIRYAPDGSQLAIGHDAALRILDARTLEARAVMDVGAPNLTALAWSGDGRLIAVGTKGSTLGLWDVERREQVARVQGFPARQGMWDGLRSLAFSPDGARLATAWCSARLFLYSVPDLTLLCELTGHHQEVFAVAWSPDGRRLASGGRDNRLRLWNPDTGGLLLDLAAHDDYIFSLAFTGDGRRIVTGSGDGTVRLWDSAPASQRWAERARARRDHERLGPVVAALFDEVGDPSVVVERLTELPDLTDDDRRVAWNLVLERVAPVSGAGTSH